MHPVAWDAMKRYAFPLLLASAAMLAGCPGGLSDPNAPPGASGMPKMPGREDADANDPTRPRRVKLVVTIRLTTVEVPVGTASGSEDVWSYLDEEPIRAVRSASLGRNGLRVGLGRSGNWPDLVRVLKRMTGRSPKQQLVASVPGDPLPIVLKERQQTQTIFTFHDDRTLSGRDFPPGDYVLAVVCTLDEDDASRILMTAMPQIRSTRRQASFAIGKAGPAMIMRPQVFNFPSLTFQLGIPAKGFLVIGPGANARNPTSVGHHYLVKKREGMEFETLLVLHPEVLAAPMK
jgi:hypothetical protein